MEGLAMPDLKKIAPGDKPKIEKAANTAFGKASKKTLADISNLQPQMRMSNQNKPQNIPMDTKQYIEKLEKENVALMQMLADRGKIIEVAGIEMQKMRTNMQKLQQQNQQLAQSHSQMLAELNSGKDRLKVLQHELGCRNGLLKAMKLEAEDKSEKETCQYLNNEVKPITCDALKEDKVVSETENTKRRRVSKSLGPKQVQSRNDAENKRPSVRRQSARFKKEDLLEIDDSKISACKPSTDPILENGSTSTSTLPDNVESNNASGNEGGELRRSSMSRPLRQAAKKVQCYKEIPLNVKMRRSD